MFAKELFGFGEALDGDETFLAAFEQGSSECGSLPIIGDVAKQSSGEEAEGDVDPVERPCSGCGKDSGGEEQGVAGNKGAENKPGLGESDAHQHQEDSWPEIAG